MAQCIESTEQVKNHDTQLSNRPHSEDISPGESIEQVNGLACWPNRKVTEQGACCQLHKTACKIHTQKFLMGTCKRVRIMAQVGVNYLMNSSSLAMAARASSVDGRAVLIGSPLGAFVWLQGNQTHVRMDPLVDWVIPLHHSIQTWVQTSPIKITCFIWLHLN